ncbi:MAG: hypothetical protein RIT40_721, partial [Planctomycetota bacterium]
MPELLALRKLCPVNATHALALEVQAFGKSYETHRAVADLSFQLRP